MRLYQIGEDHAYIEIDINSPEGIVIINKCFDTDDINSRYVEKRCSKDDVEVKFILIVDEACTIDEALERCDDGEAGIDKLKEIQSYVTETLDEFTKWFVKEYPGCKCTITIDDSCTNIDINDKTEENTNEIK